MQIQELLYIVTIAELGSFSKAAERLFVTQPALSQSVRRLEEELGLKLFNREKRQVTLTAAGEICAEYGQGILNLSQDLDKRLADITDMVKGSLRIGISQFYGRYYSPLIIPPFRKRYPAVDLCIIEDISPRLEQLMLQDELEVCIIPMPLNSPSIQFVPLFHEEVYLAVPPQHPLNQLIVPPLDGNMPYIDLSLAKDEVFILLKPDQKMHTISRTLCEQAGFSPQIAFETRSMDTVNSFVSIGMGLGFVVDMVAKSTMHNLQQQPVYYRLHSPDASRAFVAAYQQKRYLSRAGENFIQVAKEVFGTQHFEIL